MTASSLTPPAVKAVLHTLHNADGSATYTSASKSHTIVAGVNYPVEVPYRSDEVPDSTYIEVSIRPHNGVAMVKERHMESLIQQTLQSLILGQETPRCMLQVTLQVMEAEEDESLPGGLKGGGQGESYLDTLCGCLNAAILGCLDAGVRMKCLAGAASVGIDRQGGMLLEPNVRERKKCGSLHVFGFSSDGRCLLMESEGKFAIEDWETSQQLARTAIIGSGSKKITNAEITEDINMNDESPPTLLSLMRNCVEQRVIQDERWRG